jgi:hypothetical protein
MPKTPPKAPITMGLCSRVVMTAGVSNFHARNAARTRENRDHGDKEATGAHASHGASEDQDVDVGRDGAKQTAEFEDADGRQAFVHVSESRPEGDELTK